LSVWQAHIATITPYAILAALTALVFGDLPVGAGIYGPTVGLAAGVAAMTALVHTIGK